MVQIKITLLHQFKIKVLNYIQDKYGLSLSWTDVESINIGEENILLYFRNKDKGTKLIVVPVTIGD